MKIITAVYSITKEKLDYISEDHIYRELSASLGLEIMKNIELPTPELKQNGLLEYKMGTRVLSRMELNRLSSMERELKAFKELCSSSQDLVDRKLLEQEMDILKGT